MFFVSKADLRAAARTPRRSGNLSYDRKEMLTMMKKLTSEEQQRLWKLDEPPIRRIMLWGRDSKKDPCLLILYGEHKVEREIKSSPRSYYTEAYVLKPTVAYTHYAIFHGKNGHLPSIPNTHYYKKKNLLCYTYGYKTAHRYWDYNNSTGWEYYEEIDKQYIIDEFYQIKQTVAFPYYEDKNYTDYIAYLKENQIEFKDIELIEDPSDLFDFEADSPYMETIVNMFSKERLYSRRKYLSQFIKMQPSVEEYERILKVASVELACGIFQELTIEKNPILLNTAKQIDTSDVLWAKKEYHSGLNRCIQQYISVFDEKLLSEQKEFIYKTLPEMDFQIKQLTLNGVKLKGSELEEYLEKPKAYDNIYYCFGNQELYEKNTYIDGTNVKNIAYKNTIQTAKAYEMADALGKIAYYLDIPRTANYFRGSGRSGAYNYYLRYLRRILDEYKATDEVKFVTAAREMLISYKNNDYMDLYYADICYNFFFDRYFGNVIVNDEAAEHSIWNRYLEDIIFVAKNAKALRVHEFCYAILKKAKEQHKFDSYEINELIALVKIPYEKTAELFKEILLPQLEAMQEFDAEIMISLMDASSEDMWEAAKKYFKQTNGKFQPEHIAEFLFLDTIETWYSILEDNINHFTIAEYTVFLKSIAEKKEEFLEQQIELSEQITDLLIKSVGKLETASREEQQELLRYFTSLLLSFTKMPDFLFDITENIIFSVPYDVLKDTLVVISQHGGMTEREYNTVSLLKACKEESLPKDSLILSILETGSKRLVKTLTEVVERRQEKLSKRTTTMLLLFECNVCHLNQIAQSVFEGMEVTEREKLHLILLDSPIERTYQYGLQKLDDWYGNKIPTQFIPRMMEHPCVAVKAYLSHKMEQAFSDIKEANPDLYIYYVKTLLYLPNKVSKSKEQIYHSLPLFLKYYPEKQQEIEHILLDIGSTNSKIDSERALVAFARVQKEVGTL